jgi:uncharacterized protein (TIGR03435 family)
LLARLAQPPRVSAQSPDGSADWEKAAGGKMSFEVASVKQNVAGTSQSSAFPLDDSDAYEPNGGLLSVVNTPLVVYIVFAYKLTPGQAQAVGAQLPKWAAQDQFDIQARAPAGMNPTKDQLRLMMQSLLADRFKLVTHVETKRGPVFALLLVKPGKIGPQLRPHVADSACKPPDANGFPMACGVIYVNRGQGNSFLLGTRNVTMRYFADHLSGVVARLANLDRPVVDETGLNGKFDLTLAWIPDQPLTAVPGGDAATQPQSAPTFRDSLKDQLGLKLVSTTAPIQSLVIDHIEEPTPN